MSFFQVEQFCLFSSLKYLISFLMLVIHHRMLIMTVSREGLTRSSIGRHPIFQTLSRTSLRTVRKNTFLHFRFHCFLIPLSCQTNTLIRASLWPRI